MPTKIETIYSKMEKRISTIIETHQYDNKSVAFGHLCLQLIFDVDSQAANESITDGGYDNGIDAIFIEEGNERVVHFFQFKFPQNLSTINSGFTDAEINGLGGGVQRFLSYKTLPAKTWNQFLVQKHLEISELDSYKIKLWSIRYTNAQITHQEELLRDFSTQIKRQILNECDYEIFGAAELARLFEAKFERKFPTVKVKLDVGNNSQTYETDTYKSITTVVYLSNLWEAVNPVRDTIFNGNVRFYNPKTEISKAIRNTLDTNPENFILYNNGVTILTEESSFNSPNQTFTLRSASIINGAQTVGSIMEVIDEAEDKAKFNKSPILLRIIEIKNKNDIINDIVYSLNTQTKMYSTYGISNDIRLKKLQEDIERNTQYYLEIKYNEFETKKINSNFLKLKKNTLDSEKLIQCLIGYFNYDDKAYLAKLSKSDLTKDEELVSRLLDSADVSKFTEVWEAYTKIISIVSSFRSYRNSGKSTILDTLDISKDEIDKYQFLTTGDILTLYVVGLLRKKDPSIPIDQAILLSIHFIADWIHSQRKSRKSALSNITKAKATFESIKKSFYKSYPILFS